MMGNPTNTGGTGNSAVARGGAECAAATSHAKTKLAQTAAATPRPRNAWGANGPGRMARTSGA
jgi:hypothetical protein